MAALFLKVHIFSCDFDICYCAALRETIRSASKVLKTVSLDILFAKNGRRGNINFTFDLLPLYR
jgi:hypothetical protein